MISYSTLTDLIADANAERKQVDDDLSDALLALEILKTRQAQLREEVDAYTSTLTRRFPDAQPDLPSVDPSSFDLGVDMPVQVDWVAMPRTVAVERAIGEVTMNKESASPGDIQASLIGHGRNDTRDQIGGAVAHLNRTSRIANLGRAEWVLAGS